MDATLYGLTVSHPTHAVREMLALKGIEYRFVALPLGTQPVVLRAARFRRRTVPALVIDGQRVQGSREIARALEKLQPEPPLFPAQRRAAVEAAEAWGEREFQPLPRRFFRWGLAHRADLRTFLMREVLGAPAPGLTGRFLLPVGRYFAHLSRANDDYTRQGVAALPAALDHVDELIADGTIGRAGEPTAADFQIASTIAVLRSFADIAPALATRPGLELATRLFPREGQELPPFLPAEWLTALR
jgi:glutathione S-transferase